MKVYVAGKMTGIEGLNRSRFEAVAVQLRAEGHEVVIPHEVLATDDWHEAMRADIIVLLQCEKIYLLRDWRDSRGATLEAYIAEAVGMLIEEEVEIYETTTG